MKKMKEIEKYYNEAMYDGIDQPEKGTILQETIRRAFEAGRKERDKWWIKELEKRFDMEHACACKVWCGCWEKFKKGLE